MPRDIFSDVVRPRASAQPRAWYTLPLSILTHAVVVGVVIVVPLMMSDALPVPAASIVWAAPVRPPDPPPHPVAPPRAVASSAEPSARSMPRDAAPSEAPSAIGKETDAPPALPDMGFKGGGPPQVGEVGGVFTGITAPAPPAPAAPTKPIPVGGLIKYPQKVRDARPVYPAIAVANKVEGLVMIEAIIGTDGAVRDMRITRSVPLLDQAALDAVRQWRFTPSLLNGVPVPVVLTIRVAFTLR